jgi:hypothetical protein
MEVDVVIAAIGQKPLTDWVTPELAERGLKITKWNTIEADEATLQTGIPKVFTAGDIWSGPALLVDAIGTGRRAARSIHLFLQGKPLSFPEGTVYKPMKKPPTSPVPVMGVAKKPKVPQPELPAAERIKSFAEVDLTLTPELMAAEAARCLRCGTICYLDDEAAKKREELERKKTGLERLEEILRESP